MAAALCALACAALLVGCVPQVQTTPTPTPRFTSEKQAYAAAEQTYRNYVDALNKVDLSDPATFEDVYKWETGDALDSDKKSFTKMHADGWSIRGGSSVTQVREVAFTPESAPAVTLDLCRNVSRVEVKDADGKSLVGSDRPDLQPLRVGFQTSSHSATGLLVSSVEGGSQTCTA